jgi:hypothetical protein
VPIIIGRRIASGIHNDRKNPRAVATWTSIRFFSEARKKAFGGSPVFKGLELELELSFPSMNAYVVVIFFDKGFLSIKETGGETVSSSSNIGAGFETSSCRGRISYEPELRVWSENWLFLSIEMLPKLRIDGEFVGSCKSLQVYENRLKCDVSRLGKGGYAAAQRIWTAG